MKINVFKKERTTRDGRKFDTYIGRLVKKDGEVLTVQVKFKNNVKLPKEFPIGMEIEKANANLSSRKYDSFTTIYNKDNGEIINTDKVEKLSYTFWVSAIKSTFPFIDNSLDDFED